MKTAQLTASELTRLPTVPRINPLQVATLNAKARTGRRYMVSTARGEYVVGLVKYALNARGEVTGGGDMQELARFPTANVADVIAYLDAV